MLSRILAGKDALLWHCMPSEYHGHNPIGTLNLFGMSLNCVNSGIYSCDIKAGLYNFVVVAQRPETWESQTGWEAKVLVPDRRLLRSDSAVHC